MSMSGQAGDKNYGSNLERVLRFLFFPPSLERVLRKEPNLERVLVLQKNFFCS